MPTPFAPLPDAGDLAIRVLRAPSLAAGLRDLAQALAPRGIHPLAVLFRHGDALREHAAFAAGDAAPRIIPLDPPDHPLALALRAGADAPLTRVDADAFALPLCTPDADAFGLLVVRCEGPVDAALAAVRDAEPAIHARWEAEWARERLGASETRCELFGGICDALADPVLVTDRANRILLENARARALFETGPGDGDDHRARVEVNNYMFTSFLARARPPRVEARELTLVDPHTGAELFFEAVPAPLPAGAAVPENATVSLLRDVTELRRTSHELGHQVRRAQQAESRARAERDQLNLVLAHAGAPIIVTDHRGGVLLMNREAQRLFRPADDAEAPPSAVTAANADRLFAALEDFAAGDEPASVMRVELRQPATRRELPAELILGRIRDADGATAAVVSILHDLTHEVENARLASELARVNAGLEHSIREATAELMEQNRQLAWQQEELARSYRHKSEFLASMSHELRTPINALLGYTALLRERIYGDLTGRQDEALGRMQWSSEHLLDLVNDILDLAKIEAGRMPLYLEPVDLVELCRDLRDALDTQARRKGLRLEFEVAEALPVLMTDRTRVKQILLNLLSNAVKFTAQGTVSLRMRPLDEGAVEITVIDTGIGIAPQDLETIFDDFRQADQSTTREYGGTGLGLSIVRKLLGLLGGSIRVESRVGEGSAFTITLPLRSPDVREGEESIRRAMQAEAVVLHDGVPRPLPPPDSARA